MNVSRAIIENMTNEQKALATEIDQLTAKLSAAVTQYAQNEAHLRLARQFAVVPPTEAAHG